jgi:RNA polymerase sigma-70 factor (ECF subfamily)
MSKSQAVTASSFEAVATPALSAPVLRARDRYPQLAVDLEEFAEQFEACVRISGGRAAENVEDLYLAFACARQDRQALAILEQRHLSRIRQFIAHMRAQPSFVDEVSQRLRERMLIGAGSREASILGYSGRGPLAAWIRVAAMRQALDLIQQEKAAQQAHEEPEEDLLAATVDPELTAIRERHLPQVREAFHRALASLDARERNLVRLHFVDGLNIGSIGEIFGKSRATIGRMVIQCREKLLGETRRNLQSLTGGSQAEVKSLLRLLSSKLEVSVRRFLPAEDSAPDVTRSRAGL